MSSEQKRTYVVYSIRYDQLGIHEGPHFVEWADIEAVDYWPHKIKHQGFSSYLCDEAFCEDYIFVGEL